MATNVRDDRVVSPTHLAEYDQLRSSAGPQLILVAAVCAATVSGVFAAITHVAPLAVAGFVVCVLSVVFGFGASAARSRKLRARMDEISVDLTPLRSRMSIDEKSMSNKALWLAAHLDTRKAALKEATPVQEVDDVLGSLATLVS